ncbi:MAG: hypothetical protein V3V88_00065, partial [Dehalococcoidia bacterium]
SKNLKTALFSAINSGIDHNSTNNLAVGDVHTQYVLLNGRAGGQTIHGGTGLGDDLKLQGNTSLATIIFGANGVSVYDEATDSLGLNTTLPAEKFHIVDNVNAPRILVTTTADVGAAFRFDANRSGSDEALATFLSRWNGTNIAQLRFMSGTDTVNKDDGEIALFTATGGVLTEAMRIDENGNVGIGTVSPSTLLHVNAATGAGLTAFTMTNDNTVRFALENSNLAETWLFASSVSGSETFFRVSKALSGDTEMQLAGIDGTGTTFINAGSGAEIVINERGEDTDSRVEGVGEPNAFFIQGSDGFVGVGTNTPSKRVEVVDDDTTFTMEDGLFTISGGTTQSVNAIFEGDSAGFQWRDLNGPVDEKIIQAFVNASVFNIRGINDAATTQTFDFMRFYLDGSKTVFNEGDIGIGTDAPTAKLHVDQSSTTGAKPVITLDQADVDEDFFKFIGTSDTNVDRALVDAANFTTPGTLTGWLKINIQDDQATNPITDGDYYIPFYTAPTTP